MLQEFLNDATQRGWQVDEPQPNEFTLTRPHGMTTADLEWVCQTDFGWRSRAGYTITYHHEVDPALNRITIARPGGENDGLQL